MKRIPVLILCLVFALISGELSAQISPGELSKAHAALEGVDNCTKCHSLDGRKVTRAKCLDCHKEIQAEITAHKGYHSTFKVGAKECSTCHNEHHGRNFQLIKFDKKKFDHKTVGFELKGKHAQQDCRACHKPAAAKNVGLRNRPTTFMGLSQACLSCHADYHRGEMTDNCTKCHGFNAFKPAIGFNHDNTKFPLVGKHKTVSCDKCHKPEMVNGKKAQSFKVAQFANCVACHDDVHDNKFGQNCKQCHREESFHQIKSIGTFDHDKTGYKLEGKHKDVACKSCHKTDLTDPLKHEKCSDCHTDYHKGEFAKNGVTPDCSSCHTQKGFTETAYTIERHNQTKFKLEGAHAATPCFACHKTGPQWSFRNMKQRCVDCHKNVHKGLMSEKYIPQENCQACHTVESWKSVKFDHSQTGFKLSGEHARQACSACHYRKNAQGVKVQKFAGMNSDCSGCHKDSHAGQFAVNGKTDCSKCHGFDKWVASKFDHQKCRFKLEGAHLKAKCEACHKPVTNAKGTYIEYKFDNIACTRCHL